MSKFRSKIVEIEAVEWTGARVAGDPPAWMAEAVAKGPQLGGIMRMGKEVHVFTLEGVMIASPGDWIIKGLKGELYPCKPDVFAMKYEPASLTSPGE